MGAKRSRMRSGQLHQLLHAFAAEAALALAGATAAGDEVGFEVVEERARTHRPALYCYRPLTGAFVARHSHVLRGQPSARPALEEIGRLPGIASYLGALPDLGDDGLGDPAEAVLRAFIVRVFDGDEEGYLLLPERFEPAYRELFENAVEKHTEIALLGLLRGVSSTVKELCLGEGVILAPLERLGRVPPDPAWLREDRPALVVAIDPVRAATASPTRFTDCSSSRPRCACLRAASRSRRWLGSMPTGPTGARCHCRGAGAPTATSYLLESRRPNCGTSARLLRAAVRRRRDRVGAAPLRARVFAEGRLEGLSDFLLALRALLEPEGPRERPAGGPPCGPIGGWSRAR